MSLKSIELQLALPKTQELGKLQQQMHRGPGAEQSLLVTQMKKQEIERKKKTEKLSKADLEEHNTTRSPKLPKVKDTIRGNFIDLEL